MGGRQRLAMPLLLFSISVGFMLSGCSEREMPAPPSGPGGILLARNETGEDINFVHEVIYKEQWAYRSKKFKLKLRGHRLEIRKGALPMDSALVVMLSPEPGVLIVDLKPKGLWFHPSCPADLVFSYEDGEVTPGEEENLAIYREIPDGRWECLGGIVDTHRREVTIALHHFSRYALASR